MPQTKQNAATQATWGLEESVLIASMGVGVLVGVVQRESLLENLGIFLTRGWLGLRVTIS